VTDSKGHLRRIFAEIMLLFFALLVFVNGILPSMLQAVYNPAGAPVHDLVCVQVVPDSPGQAALAFGPDLALALCTTDGDGVVDAVAVDDEDERGFVTWGGTPKVRTAKVTANGRRVVLVAALASLGAFDPTGPDVRRPIRLVVYRDADQFAVDAKIEAGALGPDRLIVTLSPAGRFQAKAELPPSLLEKSLP